MLSLADHFVMMFSSTLGAADKVDYGKYYPGIKGFSKSRQIYVDISSIIYTAGMQPFNPYTHTAYVCDLRKVNRLKLKPVYWFNAFCSATHAY